KQLNGPAPPGAKVDHADCSAPASPTSPCFPRLRALREIVARCCHAALARALKPAKELRVYMCGVVQSNQSSGSRPRVYVPGPHFAAELFSRGGTFIECEQWVLAPHGNLFAGTRLWPSHPLFTRFFA